MSTASASASASSVANMGWVQIPNCELLPTPLLKGIEDAACAVLDSNSVARDLFNMSRALKLPIDEVAEDAVILIPLFTTDDSVAMNSDLLANGPILYVKLDGPPPSPEPSLAQS